MVVDSNGENPLGPILTDHILVKIVLDLFWSWYFKVLEFSVIFFLSLLLDDVGAGLYAVFTDADPRSVDHSYCTVVRSTAE